MSSRPSGKPVHSAFDNLKPTIMRQPARTAVSPESEARLLEAPPEWAETPDTIDLAGEAALPGHADEESKNLLKKKTRTVLVPVTFRMPSALKQHLEQIARKHEINQTDLINEAIELNLQRYL